MKSIAKALSGAGTAVLTVALLTLTAPAQAQDEAPPLEAPSAAETAPSQPSPEVMALIEGLEEETSQALWCAGAFGLLGTVSQSEEESAALTRLAQGLVVSAREQLADDNVAEADFIALVAGYNALVLEEFETQADEPMRYTPDECFAAADLPEPTESEGEPAQNVAPEATDTESGSEGEPQAPNGDDSDEGTAAD